MDSEREPSRRESDARPAIELAGELLEQAARLQTPHERRQQAELDRLVSHEEDKATLIEMTDQAFRTHTPARVADQLTHLLDVQGIPRFFSPIEQAMLRGFQSFGEYLPGVAVPLVKDRMRRETANVILPAEPSLLSEHLRQRRQHGVELNVNLLGEALLGEGETRRRLQRYADALRSPEIRCLSVKLTTLHSQVSPLARRQTIRQVAERLEMLYRTAGRDPEDPRFIYLDMEEYRDLYLTADVLLETLGRDGLEQARAGIALQAYVPDSFHVMRWLVEWSAGRVAAGGYPLTIRLVKGANLEMERVEASIAGWPQAPYTEKWQTDANFKRMLRELLRAAGRGEIRVGVASHNLFDVALAMIWSDRYGAGRQVQYEMLEGMANHQRRAITERDVPMLLYAPACLREEFLFAIGYLIRRLDENTGPDNFLRHAYRLRAGTPEFDRLADAFGRSLAAIDAAPVDPRRRQDRRQPPRQPPAAERWPEFVNEPDTDWSLPHNAEWIERLLGEWKPRCDDKAADIPLRVGDESVAPDPDAIVASTDPSRPGTVVCRYQRATGTQLAEAVAVATRDTPGWRGTAADWRRTVLRQTAQHLRQRRGDLIAAMMADGGKTVQESDPEISEAIDFCEFYGLTAVQWAHDPGVRLSPRGVVAVITPWNFPLAIPCGGVAAALAAGNSVILKPAAETVLPAALLCQAFWDAGVPGETLQMLPCDDQDAETHLVRDRRVDTVVLTGGTETARRLLHVRPDLHLLAETGGKNATIVTAMADRELAVKHVVQSAFGHSGQKCSATSLLLLEREVYDDPAFRELLADAVQSLPVGPAWDLTTRVGPLIAPPGPALTRGMKVLEDGESWLVVPEQMVDNPQLYRPGVKWGVRPGSFTHRNELFGPVLAVMPFRRLEEAIELVRATGYGLTSGLESLDDREIELWRQTIRAGNLYINRTTTGAIVLRQPFGGVGLSAYGAGSKAGGPHYVLALSRLSDRHPGDDDAPPCPAPAPVPALPPAPADDATAADDGRIPFHDWLDDLLGDAPSPGDHSPILPPSLAAELRRVAAAAGMAVRDEFSQMHDTFRLIGQDNFRRYRPTRGLTIRVAANDPLRDAMLAALAATAVATQTTLSIDPGRDPHERDLLESIADSLPGLVEPIEETDEQLARRITQGHVLRLRLCRPLTPDSPLLRAAAEAFTTVVAEPVLANPRIECLRYLEEQSISHDYHRYGNLGRRGEITCRPVHGLDREPLNRSHPEINRPDTPAL